ncbi:MAG TPA: non-canonical purine NTP pyrophosphatase [Verrucomicrobiae bacterium]|jgi:XTP/dITP diphosphohydrolase|nr:non-canonical purine NTP pyrophosphatase [Verrucomicrobiae bacterium]
MNASAPKTFLIATRNAHKVVEIRAILGNEFHYLTLNDFPGSPKVIEDAGTFAGNATKKAVELVQWLVATHNPQLETRNFHVLSDDSGLEVDALNGAPGVHSARFAALDSGKPDNSPDGENNAKLLRLLKDVPAEKRTARFRCVLALTPVHLETRNPKPETSASPVCLADEFEMLTEIFDGACEGRIDFAPSGKGGFGYDPLFIPNGFEQSFAELGEEIKNDLSHRSKALAKLKERLARR